MAVDYGMYSIMIKNNENLDQWILRLNLSEIIKKFSIKNIRVLDSL
jgi:hypothetical protein